MIHTPLIPSCWRCVSIVPAAVKIDRVPYCHSCARELVAKPIDMKIEPVAGKRLALSVTP
jgi:hypothetical protein